MSESNSVELLKKLNNGIEIPTVGLGVYLASKGDESRDAVGSAIKLGYRHIDTARFYHNEREVGKHNRIKNILIVVYQLWTLCRRSNCEIRCRSKRHFRHIKALVE
jgi:diketogulonate reductase-like aldo/keto reductase